MKCMLVFEDGLLRSVMERFDPAGSGEIDYAQVREMPSWPRSWANFSLYSCVPTGMHGQTGIVWANLTPFSLQFCRLVMGSGDRDATSFDNQQKVETNDVTQPGLGRIVALHHLLIRFIP